jgi:polyhydroxybutyrate depolymerase
MFRLLFGFVASLFLSVFGFLCLSPALAAEVSRFLPPGSYKDIPVEHEGDDGKKRKFDIFVPSRAAAGVPLPVIVNLHAYLTNSDVQAWFTDLNIAAEQKGYVVVYPQARFASWNGGRCCGEAALRRTEDVGFVKDVVREIQSLVPVDTSRVYAAGMSNGGFLSHRLVCEASDVFAAMASVSGVFAMDEKKCTPQRAVPVIQIHGKLDPVVPYWGAVYKGAVRTVRWWSSAFACESEKTTFEFSDTTCETRAQCRDGAEVTLCSVRFGGHCWPGNPLCPGSFGDKPFHATTALFAFFEKHRLDGGR